MVTFITPVQLSLSTTGSYQTINLSGSIPSGGTGGIFRVINTSTADRKWAIRDPSSTSDLYDDLDAEAQTWAFAKCNASRQVAVKREASTISVWLIGYFESEATFFTNPTSNTSIPTTGTWTDWDVSSDTSPDTAIAVMVSRIGIGDHCGFRKNGSADNLIAVFDNHQQALVGVDGNQILELYQEDSGTFYLLGYMESDVTMYTTAVSISLTTRKWTDYTLPSGATGGIFLAKDDVIFDNQDFGVRVDGSTDSTVYDTNQEYNCGISQASSQVVEIYKENSNIEVYLSGVFGSTSATVSSVPVLQGYLTKVRKT